MTNTSTRDPRLAFKNDMNDLRKEVFAKTSTVYFSESVLNAHDGVKVAKDIINRLEVHQVAQNLNLNDALHLTVEYLVYENIGYRQLFTAEEIETCRHRLHSFTGHGKYQK